MTTKDENEWFKVFVGVFFDQNLGQFGNKAGLEIIEKLVKTFHLTGCKLCHITSVVHSYAI